MIRLLAIAMIFVGGWIVSDAISRLSSDAVAMGIGLLFGILGIIPIALVVITFSNNQRERRSEKQGHGGWQNPPIIMIPQMPASTGTPPQQFALPATSSANRRPKREIVFADDEIDGEFRVIGDSGSTW